MDSVLTNCADQQLRGVSLKQMEEPPCVCEHNEIRSYQELAVPQLHCRPVPGSSPGLGLGLDDSQSPILSLNVVLVSVSMASGWMLEI